MNNITIIVMDAYKLQLGRGIFGWFIYGMISKNTVNYKNRSYIE